MDEYKVGDKIRIIDDQEVLNERSIPCELAGTETTIYGIVGNIFGKGNITIQIDNESAHKWHGEMNIHFFLINQPVSSSNSEQFIKPQHLHNCPLCGSPGDLGAMTFYCKNETCQNYG